MKRICNQFELADLTTLTDRLVMVCGNIENAFVQLGATGGMDYTYKDIMGFAVSLMAIPEKDCGILTRENICTFYGSKEEFSAQPWKKVVRDIIDGTGTLSAEDHNSIHKDIMARFDKHPSRAEFNGYLQSLGWKYTRNKTGEEWKLATGNYRFSE